MDNIILIGMPGVGKSTLGVLLAKTLGMTFLDTDLVIQEQEGALLRDLIADRGIEGFLDLEGRCAPISKPTAPWWPPAGAWSTAPRPWLTCGNWAPWST